MDVDDYSLTLLERPHNVVWKLLVTPSANRNYQILQLKLAHKYKFRTNKHFYLSFSKETLGILNEMLYFTKSVQRCMEVTKLRNYNILLTDGKSEHYNTKLYV